MLLGCDELGTGVLLEGAGDDDAGADEEGGGVEVEGATTLLDWIGDLLGHGFEGLTV